MSLAHSDRVGKKPIRQPREIADEIMKLTDTRDHDPYRVPFAERLQFLGNDHIATPAIARYLHPVVGRYRMDSAYLQSALDQLTANNLKFLPPQASAFYRSLSIVAAVAAMEEFYADIYHQQGHLRERDIYRNRAYCFRQNLPELFKELSQSLGRPLDGRSFDIMGS